MIDLRGVESQSNIFALRSASVNSSSDLAAKISGRSVAASNRSTFLNHTIFRVSGKLTHEATNEFDKTSTTHDDASGCYITYTHEYFICFSIGIAYLAIISALYNVVPLF